MIIFNTEGRYIQGKFKVSYTLPYQCRNIRRLFTDIQECLPGIRTRLIDNGYPELVHYSGA